MPAPFVFVCAMKLEKRFDFLLPEMSDARSVVSNVRMKLPPMQKPNDQRFHDGNRINDRPPYRQAHLSLDSIT
jgi:hypothetical protein